VKKTIFSQWPNFSLSDYEKCMVHDMKFWKASRLIKDADDLADCQKVIVQYAKELVQVFIYLAGKSVFPAIS
jgi:hypothetical protein